MAMMIDDEHVLTTAEDARDAGAVAEELRRPNPALHAGNLPPRTVELLLRVLDATARGGTLTLGTGGVTELTGVLLLRHDNKSGCWGLPSAIREHPETSPMLIGTRP